MFACGGGRKSIYGTENIVGQKIGNFLPDHEKERFAKMKAARLEREQSTGSLENFLRHTIDVDMVNSESGAMVPTSVETYGTLFRQGQQLAL